MRLIKVKNIPTSQTLSRKFVAQQVVSLFLVPACCNGEKVRSRNRFVCLTIHRSFSSQYLRIIAIFRFRPIDRDCCILVIVLPSFPPQTAYNNTWKITQMFFLASAFSVGNAFNEWLSRNTRYKAELGFPLTRTSLSFSRIFLFLFHASCSAFTLERVFHRSGRIWKNQVGREMRLSFFLSSCFFPYFFLFFPLPG